MKVYFISGIGGDHRFFKHIQLPTGFETEYLDYVPARKGESLSAYALRLAEPIDRERPFGLVGLSLGGIMATEITKRLSAAFTILIGSVASSSDMPPYFRTARRLRLHRAFPGSFFKVSATCKHIFSREKIEDKKLVLRVIWAGDTNFIRWAIDAVLEWENIVIPKNVYRINGTRDEVFPIRWTRPDYTISGGHMLVMENYREVNQVIETILDGIHSCRLPGDAGVAGVKAPDG